MAAVITEIRSLHPYAFNSGKWAKVLGTGTFKDKDVFLIQFENGDVDLWPTVDPTAQYEFKFK